MFWCNEDVPDSIEKDNYTVTCQSDVKHLGITIDGLTSILTNYVRELHARQSM